MHKNDETTLSEMPSSEKIDYSAALEKLKDVCFEAAKGNLNVRFNNRNEFGNGFSEVYSSINQLLDQVDAFIRESGASLEHASQGNFFRIFIERGMVGDFKKGASVINKARSRMEELEYSRKDEMIAIADNLENEVKSAVGIVAKTSDGMRIKSEEMSVNLEKVTSEANKVVELSNNATHSVESCAAAIEEMSASANEINRQSNSSRDTALKAVEEVKHTDEVVKKLAVAASEIGDIAGMIKDIASRTNLLALNATIEAARAGDAGKGFAVVASEVKNLSTQTAEATNQVDVQISTIQKITEETKVAVSNIGNLIQESVQVSQDVASTAEEQLTVTKEISQNVQEAAMSTRESSSNVSKVAEKTNDSSITARHVAEESNNVLTASSDLSSKINEIMGNLRSYGAFNRRVAERYTPKSTIDCDVEWNNEAKFGNIKNISRTGAAIEVNHSAVIGNIFTITPKGWDKSLSATIVGQEENIVRVHFNSGQKGLISKLLKEFITEV